MANELKGLDELIGTLKSLKTGGVKKAAKAGINAGLTELSRAMRQAVNSSPTSAPLKKAARQTLGKSLRMVGGGDYVGKAGLGVGKQTKTRKAKATARAGEGGGLGISARNIHWPVLGTKERTTKTGHKTGSMPASLKGAIKNAAASAGPAIMQAAQSKVSQVLAAEAAKARKGKKL